MPGQMFLIILYMLVLVSILDSSQAMKNIWQVIIMYDLIHYIFQQIEANRLC